MQARTRLTPKAWLQEYLAIRLPDSAGQLTFYYRSEAEDTVLFSFYIAPSDLAQLLDGKALFPGYGDLKTGGAELPEWVLRDPAVRHFVRKIEGMRNALSATRERAGPAEPREVRLWTAARTAEVQEVCILLGTGRRAEQAVPVARFPMPAVSRETHCYITIDSRLEHTYDTVIWQHWTFDAAGYREFLQRARTHRDLVKYADNRDVERLADRMHARGPAPGLSWWRPAALKPDGTEAAAPPAGFRLGETDEDWSLVLVIGRAEGIFHAYAHTQCHILTADPRDAVERLLGLLLPAAASEVRYYCDSNLAGDVAWVRFDLPLPDLVACLARTTTLPVYAEFTADAALKERLETAYRSGAPPWWQPEELQDGRYAEQRRDTKELHGLSAGLGRLPGGKVRVHIGAFSAR